jgi:hypothetical protein
VQERHAVGQRFRAPQIMRPDRRLHLRPPRYSPYSSDQRSALPPVIGPKVVNGDPEKDEPCERA